MEEAQRPGPGRVMLLLCDRLVGDMLPLVADAQAVFCTNIPLTRNRLIMATTFISRTANKPPGRFRWCADALIPPSPTQPVSVQTRRKAIIRVLFARISLTTFPLILCSQEATPLASVVVTARNVGGTTEAPTGRDDRDRQGNPSRKICVFSGELSVRFKARGMAEGLTSALCM